MAATQPRSSSDGGSTPAGESCVFPELTGNARSAVNGAVYDEELGVPAHYGNPFAEQNMLLDGRALCDLSYHEVIRVGGVDRAKWLHNLTTCDMESLVPGESGELLILDPHGHIQYAAGVVDDGEYTWLITDHGYSEGLVSFLESMRFMLRVTVEPVACDVVGVMCAREAVPDFVVRASQIIWVDPWPRVRAGGAHYGVSDERHPGYGVQRILCVIPRSGVDVETSALVGAELGNATPGAAQRDMRGAGIAEADVREWCRQENMPMAGVMAWEALRIRHWRPRLAAEVGTRLRDHSSAVEGDHGSEVPAGAHSRAYRAWNAGVLPHELDWLRTAVHLNKGCYRGQETVAKIVNLGKPPRRLTYLYLEGPDGDLPEPGTPVFLGDRNVGYLTSVARDVDEGPVALALIKRNTSAEAVLQVGQFCASQQVIVSADGKSSVSLPQHPGVNLRRGIGRVGSDMAQGSARQQAEHVGDMPERKPHGNCGGTL
ncbi:YgfZ/GcvT domain-containing protein [Trueperella sp. LYQ141]|uniref:CAF17-like 4Fe-4S cluster assembly/insertion protein YgfZ n=1 Tax=Trueperella sp. LYQ141 TaxID=3391058 RepID=UPI00398375CB